MRHTFAILLLLGIPLLVPAQGVTHLTDKLEEAATDSLKIVAYQALVNHYRYHQLDSARYFARKGIAFAVTKQYTFGEATMLYNLAQVNDRHGFLDQARKEYTEARAIFEALSFTKGVAGTTNGLGVIAGKTGKYDEATRYFLQALSIYEEINHIEGIVQTYIKLGVVSDHLGNLDDALAYYLKAEVLITADEPSNASLTLLNNIGIIYGKRNDLLTALKYFRKGIQQSDPTKFTGIHIALLGSLGLAYDKLGMQDSAWYFQQHALSMARQNHLPEEEARSLVNLAAIVSNTDPLQSFSLLNEALAITQRIQQLKLMSEVYEAMIDLHKKRNEYRLAMELSEKNQLLRDSLFSLEKSKEIAKLHATQEIARQENEIRNLAIQNDRSMFQRNIMIAVALASVAMILVIWYYNTKISHLNSQLIKKQNELRTSNTVKDKLFSVLGHDLRSPLNQVIGLLNVLALEHRDESPVIEKIRLQSQHTLETLDNLLMWGRTQLKGVRLNQQTLHVNDQITKGMFLTGHYAAEKNVRLQSNIDEDLYIHADPSHFDFVIRNLVSNAIKFSHAGGTVSLNAYGSGDQVVISIADSGVGISPELQKNIFSAGNESVKGTWNEKGSGIGLMLCKEYIEENGGKLWVDSKEGVGSTFYFSLKQPIMIKPQGATTQRV